MVRKLVTVRKVAAVSPIQGADRIEVISLDGWSCVVKVGEFKVGDLAVYFEIDSFLPANDSRWKFLESKFITWEGQLGFRVKSTKMRGQMSQGLALPISEFPEILAEWVDLEVELGKDEAEKELRQKSFEELLHVQKFEQVDKGGSRFQQMPFFLIRTDQERCQNLPQIFETWKDEEFQETTKMDGSSMTAYFVRKDSSLSEQLPALDNPRATACGELPGGRFGLCSRNICLFEEAQPNATHYWRIARKNQLPEKLSKLNRNIAIQGELCGNTIQRNFEGFPNGFHDFFLFSAWDIDEQKAFKPKEAEKLAVELGLKHVPVAGYSRLGDIAKNMDELLKRAEGKGINGKKREGIVLKHIDGEFSFKAISNSYLLKHGE